MDIVFRFDIDAPPERVLDAVKTTEGIQGFWTSRADVPDEVGGTLKLEFPVAPMPFDLRLVQSDERTVVWRTAPAFAGTSSRATRARPSPSGTPASPTRTRPAASPTRGARSCCS
jgi:hypothetical protein